jgi:hypothetical protein
MKVFALIYIFLFAPVEIGDGYIHGHAQSTYTVQAVTVDGLIWITEDMKYWSFSTQK